MLKLMLKRGEKMKARNVFVTCMLVSAVLSLLVGVSGAAWCDTDYAKRINVSVNNTGGGALTDYQIFVNLSSNPINETSIRVYNATSCTLRSHWTENETDGNSYGVWINYSSIAASVWVNDTAIYYDNATVSSVSNGTHTFVFFDDFPGSSLDTNKWTGATSYGSVSGGNLTYAGDDTWRNLYSQNSYSPSMALRSRAEIKNGTDTGMIGGTLGFEPSPCCAGRSVFVPYDDGVGAITADDSGTGESTGDAGTNYWVIDEWATWDVKQINGTSVNFFQNDTSVITHTTHVGTVATPVSIASSHATHIMNVDWILVRKYNLSEPSIALGNEENYSGNYNISGYVKTTSGVVIQNAYVSNNVTSATNYTNVTGYYILNSLINATYNISASKTDYITNYTIATISGVNLTNQNITLVSDSCYTPPTPTNLQNTTSSTWINWTWQSGTGNVTDSYNVSKNNVWDNGTTGTFYNKTNLCAGQQIGISVYAFNNSGDNCISDSAASDTQTTTDVSWANTNYAYRAIVCVQNISTNYYQIDFRLHTGTGTNNETDIFMNNHAKTSDYNDIRIYNQTGIVLSYWIEDVSIDPTRLWINATENGSVQIYYGYSGASSASNGTNTFEFFDDFGGVADEIVLVEEPSNPTRTPNGGWEGDVLCEQSDFNYSGEYISWYRAGASGDRYNVGYENSSDAITWTPDSGNPILDMSGGNQYAYAYAVQEGECFYLFTVNPGGGGQNMYLYNVTDHTNPVIMNSGNPVYVHSSTTSDWDYEIYNPGVAIDSSGRWHMLLEGKTSTSGFRIGYAYSNLTELNWTAHRSSNYVIDTAGNPYLTYIPERNALLTLHGDISGSYWKIISGYANLSDDLTQPSSWNVGVNFEKAVSSVHIADPDLIENFNLTYPMMFSYNYAQTSTYQAYLNVNKLQFYDIISNINEYSLTNKWNVLQSSGVSAYYGMVTLYKTDIPHCAILTKTYQINNGIIETRIRSTLGTLGTFIFFRRITNTNGNYPRQLGQGVVTHNTAGQTHSIIVNDSNKANTATTVDNDWHQYRLIANGSELTFKRFADGGFDTEQATVSYTDTGGLTSGHIGFEPWILTNKQEIDWVRVRVYAITEPSVFSTAEEEGPGTTPVISNVINGSISHTSQYIDWDVNQTTHNRVLYSNESDLTPAYYSTWNNSTAAPNITLSALTTNTQYWYQAWSYNTTNTSLSDNSSTLSFTTAADATPVLSIANAINIQKDWGRDFNSNITANVTVANASGVWMNFTNAEFTNTSLGWLNLTLDEWVNESHNVNAPVTNVSVTVFLNASGATNDTDSFYYEMTKRTNTATMDSAATQNVDTSESFYVNATCNEEYSDTFYGAANLLEDGDIVATDSSVTNYVNFSHSESIAGVYNYTIRFYNLTHYDNATTPTHSNVTVYDVMYEPPNPTNLQNTTGNFWVNHTWSVGTPGNVTDSYNVSVHPGWYNTTLVTYYNDSGLTPHVWSNITVWAYNHSGNGTLSIGSLSDDVQIPNNVVALTVTQNYNKLETETVFISDTSSSDADGDTHTYFCNRTDLFIDFSTVIGYGNWTTGTSDAGTYYIDIGVSDGWGSTDNKTLTIIIADTTPGIPSGLANITGDFWVNHTWATGSNTNTFNVSVNLSWTNTSSNQYYNNTPLSAHTWSNVSVYGFNSTSSELSSSVSQNTQIPNNLPILSGLPDNATTEDVNQTDIFDLDDYFSDADSDAPTYQVESNNESAYVTVTINASNNVSYTLVDGWNGTASIVINVTDGWGGEDSDTFLIIVDAAPLPGDYMPGDPTTLQNTTGNYWVNYTWNVGGANVTDSYNVSWNLTWYNTTTTTFMQKEVGASNWANITVYAYNNSGNGTLSSGSLSDNVQAPAYVPNDYPPATPTSLANTTGNGWANYTWTSGGGANVTDSYNVSWNLTWYNTTLTAYMNDTVGEFRWGNITVWAYNSSGNGSLSAGSVSDDTQAGGGTFTTSMGTTVYNLITYYGSSNSTAEQFGTDIGGVEYIAKYNGSFYTHTMGFSANNFTTVHGIGYYVYLNASGSSIYSRNNISDTPYNTQLFNRWNTIGWTNATDTNAEGVATSIGSSCDYTSSLNADGVTYTTHTVGFASNNHVVAKGKGYWVWVNSGGSWSRGS